MSRQLVESILSKNMLEANDIFEAKLKDIREKKMYEMKRMFQAEVFGGLTPAEIEARKKAGYRKAADVLGDPRAKRKIKIPLPDMKKEKKIAEDALDEAGLGAGAKFAHSMSASEKEQFRAAMKGGIGAAFKLRKSMGAKKKSDYEKPGLDPKAAKNRENFDKWIASGDRARSGGRNLDVAKSVGKTAAGVAGGAVNALAKELGSISRF
jgi:hypothetical protein